MDAKESNLDARWHGKAARRFVAGTKFADFLASQKEFYDRTAEDLRAVVDRADFGWFEKFFGVRAGARFYVIPGLVNGGRSYGPGLHAEDGLEENYQMIGVWQVDAVGRLLFDRALVSTIVDEGRTHMPIRSRSIGRRGNFRDGTRGHAVAGVRGRADGAERRGMRWRATDRTRQSGTSHTSAGADSFGPANSMICWGSTRRNRRSIRRCRHSCRAWWSTSMSSGRAAAMARAAAAATPKVASITPADGTRDVDPALTEIVVKFDRPMDRKHYPVMKSDDGE